MIDHLPYLVAYCVAVFPAQLHRELLNLPSYYILPFTIMLQCLGCLLPFLECDMIDHLPYLVAYCVAVFPAQLHRELLNLPSYYILPFTINEWLLRQ
ncbi:unnamed protein product [Plutella xylostella]|uniref:(diamondback moth) hypothetical protein n=1 Tax=Plutella xylostella TaxID=51655 RepID=A0A8S4G054_PLUXY|nr:unnamed protein product [Plutella xylostella]